MMSQPTRRMISTAATRKFTTSSSTSMTASRSTRLLGGRRQQQGLRLQLLLRHREPLNLQCYPRNPSSSLTPFSTVNFTTLSSSPSPSSPSLSVISLPSHYHRKDNHEDDDDNFGLGAGRNRGSVSTISLLFSTPQSRLFSLSPLSTSNVNGTRYMSTTTEESMKTQDNQLGKGKDVDEENDATTKQSRSRINAQRAREVAARGAHSAKGYIKQYGPVFVGTYLSVYVATLASFYAGIESGLLDPAYLLSSLVTGAGEDSARTTVEVIAEVMGHYPWTSPFVPYILEHPQYANFGVAWVTVKFTEPIRFGVSVAIVPRLARALGYVKKDTGDEDKNSNDDGQDQVKSTTAATGKTDDKTSQ